MNQTVSSSTFDLKLFKQLTQSIFWLYLSRWPSLLCLWFGIGFAVLLNALIMHYFPHQLGFMVVGSLLCIIVMAISVLLACWFLLRVYLIDDEAIEDISSLLLSQYEQFCGSLFYQVGFLIFAYGAVMAYHGLGAIFAFAAMIAFIPAPLFTIMAWDNCLVAMKRSIGLCWQYLTESVCLGILPFIVLVLLGVGVQCLVQYLHGHYPSIPYATSIVCYAFLALPLVLAFSVVLVDYWLQREALAETMVSLPEATRKCGEPSKSA